MEPPKITPITTLGKLGEYWEVRFFGSFRGSGLGWVQDVRVQGVKLNIKEPRNFVGVLVFKAFYSSPTTLTATRSELLWADGP